MMKSFPRPRDFAATNYYATVDADSCIGCGVCVKRCNLDAIEMVDKKAIISMEKCIGCGLCVPTCKPKSIELIKTENETVPPKDTEDLYDIIDKKKKPKIFSIIKIVKALFGLKT